MSAPSDEMQSPTIDKPGQMHRWPDAGATDGIGPLAAILEKAQRLGASDLLFVSGVPPTVLVAGQWITLAGEALSGEGVTGLIAPIITDEQRERLERSRDLDLGVSLPDFGRYRINVHYQQGGLAAAFRAIPRILPELEGLNLPPEVQRFSDYPSGLVLVTGGTGQGKSTTLAALINQMNQALPKHIITIEDPIEYVFPHGSCIIEQRQIGEDSPTFASALRHVLRQRPDVIFIGEMRDTETMATALTAAETGHLVLTTLHTASAMQTIARIIDVFPSAQQPQVRTQLAASLRVILCQRLVRNPRNATLLPATELLIATPAIRRAVRDNETHLIYSMIETGRRIGMHTIEQSLEDLFRAGRVDDEQALAAAADPVQMRKRLTTLRRSSPSDSDKMTSNSPEGIRQIGSVGSSSL